MAGEVAISSQKTYLYVSANGTDASYTKLIDVKNIPQIGGEPAKLKCTTLSAEKSEQYIPGLQDQESLGFTANYTKENWKKIAAITNTRYFQVRIGGTNGEQGIFQMKGTCMPYKNDVSPNSVQEFTIVITLEDGYEWKEGSV